MTSEKMVAAFLLMLSNLALAGVPDDAVQQAKPSPFSIHGSWAGAKLVNQMIQEYGHEQASRFINFVPRDSN